MLLNNLHRLYRVNLTNRYSPPIKRYNNRVKNVTLQSLALLEPRFI